MSEYLNDVNGLVIRTVDLQDNDRLLDLFTERYGKVTVYARGSRILKSKHMASSQQFCFSNFSLYKKGDRYWIKEAEPIESFYPLRENLQKMALASYICEVISDVVMEEQADVELLRLTLNSLYAIAKGTVPFVKIKGAFEIRAASILGFMPSVACCSRCAKSSTTYFLDVMNGTILCEHCHEEDEALHSNGPLDEYEATHARIICVLPEEVRFAVEYAVTADLKRLLSFPLSAENERFFAIAGEKYLLNHLERGFKTLDFYKEVNR